MEWMQAIGIWAAGGVIVVGIMQWLKGLMPQKVSTLVYVIMLPIFSMMTGIAAGGSLWLFNGLGIWAVSQIGYEAIIQGIKKKLAA